MKTTLQKSSLQKSALQKSNLIPLSRFNYLNIAKSVYKESGFKGFYRGLNIALLRSAPGITFYLSGLEYVGPKIKSQLKHENISNMVTAGIVRSIALYYSCL